MNDSALGVGLKAQPDSSTVEHLTNKVKGREFQPLSAMKCILTHKGSFYKLLQFPVSKQTLIPSSISFQRLIKYVKLCAHRTSQMDFIQITWTLDQEPGDSVSYSSSLLYILSVFRLLSAPLF